MYVKNIQIFECMPLKVTVEEGKSTARIDMTDFLHNEIDPGSIYQMIQMLQAVSAVLERVAAKEMDSLNLTATVF